MSKHTPGPWRLDRIPTSWRICDPTKKSSRGPRLIAYAPHLAQDAEANARLIAAAPDLLFQLLAASKYIDALGGDSRSYRQVIAKATGEQQ